VRAAVLDGICRMMDLAWAVRRRYFQLRGGL
jgi:hypothetical protein